jgi:subtilisin family serine protease
MGRPDRFVGMAPGARLVSVKVANRSGAADVSQVIAAIDWVVQQRNRHGLNIRVLNLSFGTDSAQDYRLDPLSFAAEVAWRKGIVVVAAAGNGRADARTGSTIPAFNPFLLAVGAADNKGTKRTRDDEILAGRAAAMVCATRTLWPRQVRGQPARTRSHSSTRRIPTRAPASDSSAAVARRRRRPSSPERRH